MTQEPVFIEGDYYGQYRWLERHDRREFLYPLVRHCPEALLGKHLVVTALDSGPADIAVSAGWRFENRVLISPKLDRHQIGNIPYDEWSEWFLFNSVTPELAQQFDNDFKVLVNQASFSLASVDDFDWPLFWKNAGKHLQDIFWTQMHLLQPHSYIAEGDNSIYVTNNTAAFATVRNWAMNL